MTEQPFSLDEMHQQQAQKAEMEERRLSILGKLKSKSFLRHLHWNGPYIFPDQILEPAAKDRIARLALVKKEKARSVEDALISAATSGKLKSKVILLWIESFGSWTVHLL